jgi:hypothetical protein
VAIQTASKYRERLTASDARPGARLFDPVRADYDDDAL